MIFQPTPGQEQHMIPNDFGAPNLISIRSDLDIIAARMAAREFARKLGFSTIDQARIATATSELARIILTDAGEGSISIWQLQPDSRSGIELVLEDKRTQGTDNHNIWQNWVDPCEHVATGLTAVRRLMDELEIKNDNGTSVTVTCRKWQRK
jgi:serine/threonine-protein kinase RsbT